MEDDVILERLTLLREYVDYLKTEATATKSFQDYVDNVRLRRAVERSLQVAAEACLDIGNHIVAREGFRYPEDNKDVFVVLNEEKIVSDDLLPYLVDMARFRNLVVHDYAPIDNAKVYDILKKRLGDFDQFARAIVDYMESQEKEDAAEDS